MEINQEIYEKAKAKIEDRANTQEYIFKCHSARICPKCGNPLEVREEYRGFFGFVNFYNCSSCDYKT